MAFQSVEAVHEQGSGSPHEYHQCGAQTEVFREEMEELTSDWDRKNL